MQMHVHVDSLQCLVPRVWFWKEESGNLINFQSKFLTVGVQSKNIFVAVPERLWGSGLVLSRNQQTGLASRNGCVLVCLELCLQPSDDLYIACIVVH